MRSLRFYFSFVVFLVSLFGLSGCEKMKRNLAASEISIKEFHALYNQRKFEEIYWMSDANFRDATSLEEWITLVGTFREKYGSVVSSKTAGFNINFKNSQYFVRLKKGTKFSHGNANEEFYFVISGTRARLLGYRTF